jgi:sodium transport system permease protein
MYAVPLLGQHLTVTRLVRGEAVAPADIGLCLASGLAVAAVAWIATRWVYGSDRLAISA